MLKEGDRLTELIVQKERLEYEMEANTNAAEEGGEFDEARQLEIEAELFVLNQTPSLRPWTFLKSILITQRPKLPKLAQR